MATYAEMLRDPRWQRLSAEIKERDDWRCRWCDDRHSNLQVDHKRYVRGADPWEAPRSDLITLCEGCHKRITALRREVSSLIGEFNVYELPIIVEAIRALLPAPETPQRPARHWILEEVDAKRIAAGLIG